MTSEIDRIHELVVEAAKRGPLAEAVTEVTVEPAFDEDDEEFLRIVVNWRPPEGNVDAELETLLENIEEAVATQDTRYASVRFLDAA